MEQKHIRERKNFSTVKKVYDLVMALLILSVAVLMFFGDRWDIPQIRQMDGLMRNLFGGLCVLYGGFRLYRALKKEEVR